MLNRLLTRTRTAEPDLPDVLPRTQTQIRVVDARADCLIDRDGNVIAAIAVASLDTTLLTAEAVGARIEAYREFLKTLRYPIQFLIGTRPQDLWPFLQTLAQREERLAHMQARLDALLAALPGYLALPPEHISATGFESYFGFHPRLLIGTPGGARLAVRQLCDPAAVAPMAHDALATAISTSVRAIERWREAVLEHADMIQDTVQRAQAPVRTYFIVTSTNPRLLSKTGGVRPLDEREFRVARERLDERCRQIHNGLEGVGVDSWRASHDDLLLELRHFFNPALSVLAGRAAKDLADLEADAPRNPGRT